MLELQGSENDLIILEGLEELDRGAWCGLTIDEIGVGDMMEKFNACDESVAPDGGNSFPALKNRVLFSRDMLLELKEPGRASAVVSHLQVTRSILSDALGVPTNDLALLKVATASMTCIDYCTVDCPSIVPQPVKNLVWRI